MIKEKDWSTPNPERDDPRCEEMTAMMEAHIDRQRWFIYEESYANNEADKDRLEELNWLLGRYE